MDFSITLVNLAGSVALLLWGVHMVQTGVQRALGARLRGPGAVTHISPFRRINISNVVVYDADRAKIQIGMTRELTDDHLSGGSGARDEDAPLWLAHAVAPGAPTTQANEQP